MSQAHLKSARSDNLEVRVPARRRVAWRPVTALDDWNRRSLIGSPKARPIMLPGEYGAPVRSQLARRLGLASDISLLIIASPILACWWLYRGFRQKLRI
jgi:hypothetical protein